MIKITIELEAMIDPIISFWMNQLIESKGNSIKQRKIINDMLDRPTFKIKHLEATSSLEYEPPVMGLHNGGHIPKKEPMLTIEISG
jgi:hypothetical protein